MSSLPIVFLPGLLCTAKLFEAQISGLSTITKTHFIALNHATSISEMAQHVLDKAPPKFALCAFSMGGYVAFEILRQKPEAIAKLALISTTARLDEPTMRQRRKDFIALAQKGKFRGITRQLLPQMIDHSRLDDHDLTDAILNMRHDMDTQTFINQETAILGRPESLDLLPHISCPTTIIAGQHDVVTPPECQAEMHRLIPDARLFLLENTGHMSVMEQPKRTTQLLLDWYMGK